MSHGRAAALRARDERHARHGRAVPNVPGAGQRAVISAQADEARRGDVNLQGVVDAHDPAVIVYDVQPPYDINWRYLEGLRTSGAFKGRPVVITTTNEKRLREFVASGEPVIEIFGKPYDMNEVVTAVRRAAGDDSSYANNEVIVFTACSASSRFGVSESSS